MVSRSERSTARLNPLASRRESITLFLPWLLALAIAAGILLFHYNHRLAEIRDYETETRVTAQQISSRLSAWLRDRVAVVEHMALHGQPVGDSRAIFKSEASAFIERISGFQALNWINSDGIISVVVPFEPNKGALGRSLLDHPLPGVRNAFLKANQQRVGARTLLIQLYQGGEGIAMYWPMSDPEAGVMNGVFRVDAMMADALQEQSLFENYSISLLDEDSRQIYASDTSHAENASQYDHSIDFVDRPMTVRVAGKIFPAAVAGGRFWWAGALLAGLLSGYLLHHYLGRQRSYRQQSQQIRLIMDSTVEGILGLDLAGVCIFCNAASVKALGFESAEQMVGQEILQQRLERLNQESDADSAEAIHVLGEVRQGLTRENRSAFMRRADGTLFATEYVATPTIERGEVTGMVFTFFDITGEVIEAERLNRYQRLMNSVPELTIMTDAQALVETINPAGVRLLKADARQLLGRPLREMFAASSRQDIESIALPSLQGQGQGVWEGESELEASDGEKIPVRLVLLRLEDHFGDVYFSLIARDISGDRRMEAEQQSLRRQFQHAQKMESLGLLAGGIAHDFNNILVAVLGNASLAMEHLTPGSREHALLSAVETATQRAADLTRQLLAYSGRGRFELAATDLGVLVTEMADLLRASLPPSVRLTVTCDDQLHSAMVDPTQIRQLVMNLITNGADAIGPERAGRVEVQVTRIRWDPVNAPRYVYGHRLPAGDYVAIKVEDDGRGMDHNVITRIFDPFFSTKAAGRGLGLSAVLGIVQGHNGMMCLESDQDSGTCFMLVLPPCSSTPPLALSDDSHRDRRRYSGKVLLIDDEPMVREFAEAALSTLGFEVITAANGQEGLELFEQNLGDLALVLIDQSMPGMSGAETRQAMCKVDDSVPSVLMSGYDEQQVSATLAEMGFGGFLKKPFRYAELRSLLHRVLQDAA